MRLGAAALVLALGPAAGCAPCGGAPATREPEAAPGSATPTTAAGVAPVFTDPQSAMLMPMRTFDASGQADRFSLSVRWPAATHPDGIAAYEVRAGGELLATTGPAGRGLVIDVDTAPPHVEVVAVGLDEGRSEPLRIAAPPGLDVPPVQLPVRPQGVPVGDGEQIPEAYRARPAEPTPGLPTPIATPPPPVMPPPPGVTSAPPGSLPAPNAPGAAPATGAPPLGPTPDAGGADARDN